MTPSNPKGTGAPSRAWTDAEVEAAARALAAHAYGQRGMALFPEDWNRIRRSSMDGMRAALSILPPVSVPSREEIANMILQADELYSWGGCLALADSIITLFTAPQSE